MGGGGGGSCLVSLGTSVRAGAASLHYLSISPDLPSSLSRRPPPPPLPPPPPPAPLRPPPYLLRLSTPASVPALPHLPSLGARGSGHLRPFPVESVRLKVCPSLQRDVASLSSVQSGRCRLPSFSYGLKITDPDAPASRGAPGTQNLKVPPPPSRPITTATHPHIASVLSAEKSE